MDGLCGIDEQVQIMLFGLKAESVQLVDTSDRQRS
jgi:hypothetical protein